MFALIKPQFLPRFPFHYTKTDEFNSSIHSTVVLAANPSLPTIAPKKVADLMLLTASPLDETQTTPRPPTSRPRPADARVYTFAKEAAFQA